ncbi:MAG: dehydrogenase [Clostridia bacterium]|nr:dehydrogenase [Clostridia bacterium]MBR7160378.1 dehydrogenase [Clostridia bacterium]
MPKSLFVDPQETLAPGQITFDSIPVNQYNKTIQEERSRYSDDDLVRIYRDIAILREFESMLNQIKTQGVYNGIETTYPGPAHLSIGQEAAAVGQAYLLDQNDFSFGSHRSHSEILAKALSCIHKLSEQELMTIMEGFLGGSALRATEKIGPVSDVKELAIRFILYGTLSEIFARDTGFHKGMGGSMHAFFLPFGIYPNNAIVGGSAAIATGAALFKKINNKQGIVVCNSGDGSMARGPVWEAMNFAAMDQFNTLWESHKGGMPILYNVFNNSYGMGDQTRGETMGYDMLARIGSGVSPTQFHAERINGFNPLAVIDAMERKLKILRNEGGPVLLDTLTYRFSGHSTSDQNAYRTKEEIEAWRNIDPIITYRQGLVDAGVVADSKLEEILADTIERMTTICKAASNPEISPYVDFRKDPQVVERLMFSNQKVDKLDDREPEVNMPLAEVPAYKKLKEKERSPIVNGKPVSKMKLFNLRDALSEVIYDRFYEDPTLVAYGEDCRDWGGAFAVYRGMMDAFPHSRLFNSPIAEAAIVGTAVGYAVSGGRALVELMYADFIGCAGDEIFNQMSKWQAMSAGILKMPVVLRVSVGSKYGAQHSQDWTALCAHIPGLKVCFPATPWEAKGLMESALRGTDPVVFFESQRIYDVGEQFHEGGVPAERYEIEFGDTNKVRDGKDVTILTIGAALYRAVDAAKQLSEKYGVEADIINIHSLVPLDYTKIIESVKKTGRVVLVSDACARGSFMSDVAKNITELCFDDLDAPPVVVGARNWITPPYEFDEFFFPQASWIIDAISEKLVPLPGHVVKDGCTEAEAIRRAKQGV